MRLFIAIPLEERAKDRLQVVQSRLAKQGPMRTTSREMLHMTVVFLGETKRAEAVCAAMEEVQEKALRLTLTHLGHFRQGRGNVIWAGISPSEPLILLYERLCQILRRRGFLLEKRVFCPHVTLARGAATALDGAIPPIAFVAERLSLMQSERVNGVLRYTELHQKRL